MIAIPVVLAVVVFLLAWALVGLYASLGAAMWFLLGPVVLVGIVFMLDKFRVD